MKFIVQEPEKSLRLIKNITMLRSSIITESSVWTPRSIHVHVSYSSLQIFGQRKWC